MLRKEARDALKRFIESLVALLVIPFIYVGDKLVTKVGLDYVSLIQTGFFITLIIYAVYAGATVFQSERKDRAFEYLFSLPLTRRKIILAKVLPRLGLLLLLGGVATIVIGRGLQAESGIALLVLFFSSLFLSIGVFSIVISLFGVGLMYLTFFGGEIVFRPPPSKARNQSHRSPRPVDRTVGLRSSPSRSLRHSLLVDLQENGRQATQASDEDILFDYTPDVIYSCFAYRPVVPEISSQWTSRPLNRSGI